MSIPLNLVFEDALSESIMNKLVSSFDDKFFIGYAYNGAGFGYIKDNIHGFNEACITTPFFVLTDLDNLPCPPYLIKKWLTKKHHENLIFRVAVKEVEAWLLADKENFSEYIGVSKSNFPHEPEKENDPKRTLINLVRKSRKRLIREDIVPINDNAKIGPNYNGRLIEFVYQHWNLALAMENSESLKRTYRRLDSFQFIIPE